MEAKVDLGDGGGAERGKFMWRGRRRDGRCELAGGSRSHGFATHPSFTNNCCLRFNIACLWFVSVVICAIAGLHLLYLSTSLYQPPSINFLYQPPSIDLPLSSSLDHPPSINQPPCFTRPCPLSNTRATDQNHSHNAIRPAVAVSCRLSA